MNHFKRNLALGLIIASSGFAYACSSDDSGGKSNGEGDSGTDSGSGGTTGSGGSSSGGTSSGGTASGGTSSGGTSSGGTSSGGSTGSDGGKVFDAGSDPNRNKVTAGGICQRLAEIQCAGEAYCCNNPGRTEAQCVTAVKADCTNNAFLDDIAAKPEAGFDATKAETAFTAFEDKASNCDTSIADFAASADGLRGIVAGTVDAGNACDPTSMADAAAIGAALASCKDPATTACLPVAGDAGSWTCTALSDAGGACFSDVNCKAGLYCDNPNLDFAGGTCAARKAAGESCTLSNECTSFVCAGSGDSGKTCGTKDTQTVYCLGG